MQLEDEVCYNGTRTGVWGYFNGTSLAAEKRSDFAPADALSHLTLGDVQRLMRQLIAAVNFMRNAGVSHNDLLNKRNILVNDDFSHICIIDYGLSSATPPRWLLQGYTPALEANAWKHHDAAPWKDDTMAVGAYFRRLLSINSTIPFQKSLEWNRSVSYMAYLNQRSFYEIIALTGTRAYNEHVASLALERRQMPSYLPVERRTMAELRNQWNSHVLNIDSWHLLHSFFDLSFFARRTNIANALNHPFFREA